MEGAALLRVLDAAAYRWAASWTLEGKVPALALLKPAGKEVGGKVDVSPAGVVVEGESLGGEPPEVKARSAGGRYRAPILSSASISLALESVYEHESTAERVDTHLLAYAADRAGGGVFPEGILRKEPLLSEADRDIIALNGMDAIRYY